MSDIQPFGTSADGAQPDLAVIKAFGCTVIDFSVSADWSSQAGSLSFKIIEDEADGDRLVIPVLGSPHLFELKDTSGNVLFQYIGLVDSFSRSSSNSKTYSIKLTSPLTILDATQVILDGFLGLGGSLEGLSNKGDIPGSGEIEVGSTGIAGFGTGIYDFGHRNDLIGVSNSPGTNQWWNVSNLINAFGLWENEHPLYGIPFQYDTFGNPTLYGDYGAAGTSADGMPLVKLMHALHVGINHLPVITNNQRQQTQGGNLLFGRHNYNVIRDDEGIPYYYHFDALDFYNQVKDIVGPQYRVGGSSKTLNSIVSDICNDANLEYYCYIDLYTDTSIGDPTLQEDDPNWSQPAICSWNGLNTSKFAESGVDGGRYGGTIRIQTIDKNSFINLNKPFSNIAYNLIGLEVPDLKDEYWSLSGIHPGKRPISESGYGLATPELSGIYSDPLDSSGIDFANEGFTDVGTQSIASGGKFPVATEYWDSGKLNDLKITSSDISIKLNDFTTMKVVTGGKQTRLVTVPKASLKCYWGDIILPPESGLKTFATETDPLGINQTSLRKIPVVTVQLDPRDMDDFIFIDMKDIVGDIDVTGVLHRGVYAASMYEIRVAMGGGSTDSFSKWFTFMETFKYTKLNLLRDYYYPNCTWLVPQAQNRIAAAGRVNQRGGLGFGGCTDVLGYYSHANQMGVQNQEPTREILPLVGVAKKNKINNQPVLNQSISCQVAESNLKRDILSKIHEKIKNIGDTHYGKSWYIPVPYFKTKEDLDGENLVGNFERSWELTDSAYVEPSAYYSGEIPQSNMFINDGKVSPFVNYDFEFVFDTGNVYAGTFDEAYIQDLNSVVEGKDSEVFNFSEYSLDQLCTTKYSGIPVQFPPATGEVSIIHAAPQSIEDTYSFIPYAYETYYDRTLLPFYSPPSGTHLYYLANKSAEVGPSDIGQGDGREETTDMARQNQSPGFLNRPKIDNPESEAHYSTDLPSLNSNPLRLPTHTASGFLISGVSGLHSLDYADNGRFQFAYVKCSTGRVFLPPVEDNNLLGIQALRGWAASKQVGSPIATDPQNDAMANIVQQPRINQSNVFETLYPAPIAVAPRNISYAQISNRHVYGPWITSLEYIPFRGKIEYEQDDSLVPENFLIPTNFGQFGDFTLSQTSGLEGLNLAAQGRANAIDDFALFAVEEGSIRIPGMPAIKRIGDSLYGLPQVTDISINVTNSNIETSYSFKTISPRFNKNNRDIEKNLSKISNKIKKIQLR